MKDRPAKNIAASVPARLTNHARAVGRPANDVFLRYAMERFLYRLSRSDYRDRFVLKGALMLVAWRAPSIRPTADIDLLGRIRNDPDTVLEAIRAICNQAVEADGVQFMDSTVRHEAIAEEVECQGLRIRFEGRLDTIRLHMQIDCGFGDVAFPSPDELEFPTILDQPAPRLLAYPRETAIAEKFQVMLFRQTLNSRMKDYYDIWLLSRSFMFDGARLGRAIVKTCKARDTLIPPEVVGLQRSFAEDASKIAQWRAFRSQAGLTDAPERFADVVQTLSDFLGPVARALAAGDAFAGAWPPGGPWRLP